MHQSGIFIPHAQHSLFCHSFSLLDPLRPLRRPIAPTRAQSQSKTLKHFSNHFTFQPSNRCSLLGVPRAPIWPDLCSTFPNLSFWKDDLKWEDELWGDLLANCEHLASLLQHVNQMKLRSNLNIMNLNLAPAIWAKEKRQEKSDEKRGGAEAKSTSH